MTGRETARAIQALSEELEFKSAQEVLVWALGEFHPRIALAASFGAEDVVLIDMLAKLNPKARIFTLDTGLAIKVYFPATPAVEIMVREHGVNLFYKSIEYRRRCCGVRKVEPLGRALAGLDAWISGLRREQAVTRSGVRKIEMDVEHGLVKVNPLADWTSEQVWAYIRANHVPYNALHDRGYPSIGCAPCTRAVGRGEDARAGRWWWESPETKECGLHVGRR